MQKEKPLLQQYSPDYLIIGSKLAFKYLVFVNKRISPGGLAVLSELVSRQLVSERLGISVEEVEGNSSESNGIVTDPDYSLLLRSLKEGLSNKKSFLNIEGRFYNNTVSAVSYYGDTLVGCLQNPGKDYLENLVKLNPDLMKSKIIYLGSCKSIRGDWNMDDILVPDVISTGQGVVELGNMEKLPFGVAHFDESLYLKSGSLHCSTRPKAGIDCYGSDLADVLDVFDPKEGQMSALLYLKQGRNKKLGGAHHYLRTFTLTSLALDYVIGRDSQ